MSAERIGLADSVDPSAPLVASPDFWREFLAELRREVGFTFAVPRRPCRTPARVYPKLWGTKITRPAAPVRPRGEFWPDGRSPVE